MLRSIEEGRQDQAPEQTGDSEWVESQELPGLEDKGDAGLQAVEVFEMIKRQQKLGCQIALKMEGKGPCGITTDKVAEHSVLRKVLPMLWELPMASCAEYDGIGLLRNADAEYLVSLPPDVDIVFAISSVREGSGY